MSMESIKEGALWEKVFLFNEGEKLSYNSQKDLFCVIPNHGAPEACKISLKNLARKINDSIQPTTLTTLSATQLINLSHNIRHINTLFDAYNASIKKSRFLAFIDRLIRIITCGHVTLKYRNIRAKSLESYIVNQLDPIFADQFSSVLQYLMEANRIREFPRLASALMIKAPAVYHQLASEQKECLMSLVNEYTDVMTTHWTLTEHLAVFHDFLALKKSKEEYKNLYTTLVKKIFQYPDFSTLCADENFKDIVDALYEANPEEWKQLLTKNFLNFSLPFLLTFTEKSSSNKEISPIFKELLNCVLSRFSELSLQQKNKIIIPLTENALAAGLQLPKWDSIKSTEWCALLQATMDQDIYNPTYHLRKALYSLMFDQYAHLPKPTRSHFFRLLLWCDVGLKNITRIQLFDFIRYLSSNKDQHNDSLVKIIFKRVQNLALTPKEIRRIIKWLDSIDFIKAPSAEMELRKNVGPSRIANWVMDLAANPKNIVNYNRLAFLFCKIAADVTNNLQDDIWQAIRLVMERLNLLWLNEEEFKNLISSGFLSKIVHAEPDRFLVNVSPEVRASYFAAREKDFKVNLNHIKTILVENSKAVIPPLPPGEVVFLSELVDIFKGINFENSQRPNYLNPADMGCNSWTAAKKFQLDSINALEWVIDKILKRPSKKEFAGVPEKNDEKEKFYDAIELQLKHIILQLRKRAPVDCSHVLKQLIALKDYCAEALQGTVDTQYSEVLGVACDIAAESVIMIILNVLADKRQKILFGQLAKRAKEAYDAAVLKEVNDILKAAQAKVRHILEVDEHMLKAAQAKARHILEVDVHILKAAYKSIGAEFGLKKALLFNHTDQFENNDIYKLDDPKGLLEACISDYGAASTIIEEIQNFINSLEKLEEHGKFYDWFRDNAPNEWKKENIEKLKKATKELYKKRKKELLESSPEKLQKEITLYINANNLVKYGIAPISNPQDKVAVEVAIKNTIQAAREKKIIPTIELRRLIQSENNDNGLARLELQEEIAFLTKPDNYINLQLNSLLQKLTIGGVENPLDWNSVKEAIEKVVRQEYSSVAFFKNADAVKVTRQGVIDMLLTLNILEKNSSWFSFKFLK